MFSALALLLIGVLMKIGKYWLKKKNETSSMYSLEIWDWLYFSISPGGYLKRRRTKVDSKIRFLSQILPYDLSTLIFVRESGVLLHFFPLGYFCITNLLSQFNPYLMIVFKFPHIKVRIFSQRN